MFHKKLYKHLVLLIILLLTTCAKEPTEPLNSNPFDPRNPATQGDPFLLQAQIANGGITLTWNRPDMVDLQAFRIYRSEEENGRYQIIVAVNQNITQHVDQSVLNGHSYWYRVTALNTGSIETKVTNTVAVNIKTEPVLVINGGEQYTAIREVNLTILANTAQQMLFSNYSDFQSAQWENYTTSKTWTLLSGEGLKTVYLKVRYDNGNESESVSADILPQPMNPSIFIENDSTFASARTVMLQLSAQGGTQMYLSNTPLSALSAPVPQLDNKNAKSNTEILENKNLKVDKSVVSSRAELLMLNSVAEGQNSSEGWEDFSASKSWTLLSGEGQKTVYVKFKNDFEIESEIVSDDIMPQPINPGISLAAGAQYAPARNIPVTLSASGSNIIMKLSQDSTFTGDDWQNYSSTLNFDLSSGAGTKTVYAQFKNDFEVESEIVSDDIMPQPINPGIIIAGGAQYTPTRDVSITLSASGTNLRMKVSQDSMFTDSDWQNYSSPLSFNLSSGAGSKTVYVQFINDFEIESAIVSDAILPQPINPGIIIAGGAQYTPTRNVSITLSASGTNLRMKVSQDSTFTGDDWQNYSSPLSFNLSFGAGTKTVYARFKNDFEIESAMVFDSIEPKLVSNYSFIINNGADTTNSLNVVLTIYADDATHMIIANDENFSNVTWENYSQTRDWILEAGGNEQPEKSRKGKEMDLSISRYPFAVESFVSGVFMKFKNDFDIETETITEEIVVEILSWIKINNDSMYTSSRAVILNLFSENANEMIIAGDSSFVGNSWEPYVQTKNWNLPTGVGPHYVYVKFRNNSGAVSSVYFDDILPRPINPGLTVAGGAQYTSTRDVQLTLSASGTNLRMKIAEDSTFTSIDWQTYQNPIDFTLTTGEGQKTVYAKFINDFEIESDIVFDSILPQPMNPGIIIASGAAFTSTQDVQINLSATGSSLVMRVSQDSTFTGIDWQEYSNLINFNLSTGSGNKTVYAQFKNDFEIESNIVSDNIYLDVTPPTPILVVSPESGITNETNFQFDPLGSYDNYWPTNTLQARYDWQNDGIWDTNWQLLQVVNYTYLQGGGNKTVKMQLQDGAGWQADITVTFIVNTRPVPLFTISRDANNYLLYHFDASASFDYEDGSNLQYRWDWENDGSWDTGFSSTNTISHSYSIGGDYTIKVEVRDTQNLSDTTTDSISIILLEWLTIPAGSYTWGSYDSSRTIDYDYQIMKYEVTNAQYITYLEEALAAGAITVTTNSVEGYYSGDAQWPAGTYGFYNLAGNPGPYNVRVISWNGSHFSIPAGYEDHPVIFVTWFGANAMAEHYSLSLPTEEEWEKAARGNTGWNYPWGDNIDGSRANYLNSADPFDNGTTPVGFYNGQNYQGFQTTDSPSPYGAYDLAGNVWEWTDSFYGGFARIIRGGSWKEYSNYLPSWFQSNTTPTLNSSDFGFRLCWIQ
jgi:formylglycine-generating enzyme required for sulfatase activity/fibronectin type 3 domain-containing protein